MASKLMSSAAHSKGAPTPVIHPRHHVHPLQRSPINSASSMPPSCADQAKAPGPSRPKVRKLQQPEDEKSKGIASFRMDDGAAAAAASVVVPPEGRTQQQGGEAVKKRTICAVCRVESDNHHVHYGALACFSCRAFFRRAHNRDTPTGGPAYVCKKEGKCDVTSKNRKKCQRCRYERCLSAG